MTHTLTHTKKGADADNGAKSVFDLILLEQRWPESVENQGLEGSQSVGKDEVGSSNLPSSSTRTALFVEKRAVLFYLRNFIVVIKHLGWWLTTHSATDRKTRPPEFALQRSCCILAHFLFLFQPFFFPSDLRIHLLDQICQQSLAPSCRAPGKRC